MYVCVTVSICRQAADVAQIAVREKKTAPLALGYPFIEAEVLYGIRHEYALTAVDILARRVRLAFLNHEAAVSALDQVIALCAQELQWDTRRQAQERTVALAFLETMNRDGLQTQSTVTTSQ